MAHGIVFLPCSYFKYQVCNVYLRSENPRKSGAAKYNSAESYCKNVHFCIYIAPANARRNSAGLMPSYFLKTTEKYELS